MSSVGVMIGLFAIGAIVLGVGVGFLVSKMTARRQLQVVQQKAEKILEQAELAASFKLREADLEDRDRLQKLRSEFERATHEQRGEILALERRQQEREGGLNKRATSLDRKDTEMSRLDKDLKNRERVLSSKENQSRKTLKQLKEKMEEVADLSIADAKRELKELLLQETRVSTDRMAHRIEAEAREGAENRAREVIVSSMERLSGDLASNVSVAKVHLPQEELKGRIIGKEGRNIRALERSTGVDFILDDAPKVVLISSFDPLRREIAKISLERLIEDGRFHPGRIGEIVEKVKKETDKLSLQVAQKILSSLGIRRLHPELLKLLGRLQYRSTGGQNTLEHSRESAVLCGLMAEELGLDAKLSRRAALLHDIGKAVDEGGQGSHAQTGSELARKYGEAPKVVNAIAAHHQDISPSSSEAVLVSVAQSLSASRPGARREDLKTYFKRLTALEEMVSSLDGVEEAYVLQAGGEIRIIANSGKVSEEESSRIAREVAQRLGEATSDSEEIQVTVVREARQAEKPNKVERSNTNRVSSQGVEP